MGARATRVKRKKVENKKTGISNVPGIPPPPPFSFNTYSSQNKPQAPVKDDLKKIDINKLPRDTKASEDLDAALADANRKLFQVDVEKDDEDKFSIYSDISFVESELVDNNFYATVEMQESDPDIEYLINEVERRAKLKEDLDAKIKFNERKLKINSNEKNRAKEDHLEQKQASLAVSLNEDDLMFERLLQNENEIVMPNQNDKIYMRKQQLKRELLLLNEIENRQRLKILEQDREFAVQNMKYEDEIVINDSLMNYDTFKEINNYNIADINVDENREPQSIPRSNVKLRKHLSDASSKPPSNANVKRYMSMVTKYEKNPLSDKIEPTQQLIQYPENEELFLASSNDIGYDSKDSSQIEFLGILKKNQNNDNQEIVPRGKSFLYSDSDESVEKDIRNPGLLNLSSSELQSIAIVIEDQETRARKAGVNRTSAYFYNGLQLYPDGIIENLIKTTPSRKEESTKKQLDHSKPNEIVEKKENLKEGLEMFAEKNSNQDSFPILSSNTNKNKEWLFHESESSIYNKMLSKNKQEKKSDKDESSYVSIKSELSSNQIDESKNTNEHQDQPLDRRENKIENNPTLTLKDIENFRRLVKMEPMTSLNLKNSANTNEFYSIKTLRDNDTGVYTSIEEKLNYTILSRKDLVKVEWEDDFGSGSIKKISDNSDSSFLSRMPFIDANKKGQPRLRSPFKSNNELPKNSKSNRGNDQSKKKKTNGVYSSQGGLVKVNQIDPISLNKARIKSSKKNRF